MDITHVVFPMFRKGSTFLPYEDAPQGQAPFENAPYGAILILEICSHALGLLAWPASPLGS